MLPEKKIKNLISRHAELEKELSSGQVDKNKYAELSKEYSNLNEIITEAKEYVLFDKNKEELEKIILCDVQIEIYPDIEKALLDLLHSSGYPSIKFEKKVDFESLYKQRFN